MTTTIEHSQRLTCERERAINDARALALRAQKPVYLYVRGHQYLTTHEKRTTLYGSLVAVIDAPTEAQSL